MKGIGNLASLCEYVSVCAWVTHLNFVKGEYTFAGGLKYQEIGWAYCVTEDRRFYIETLGGVKPAGISQFSDTHPLPIIPKSTYDCGDGYAITVLGYFLI